MQDEGRELPLSFTGRASEYFRIWIIGVALSVLTLGIYSPWAKVRREQYLYRHTWLDGTSFEYTADPRALLRGRLLIAAFLAAVFALEVLYVHAGLAAIFAVFLVVPWVVVRATGFRARSSRYRNVPFAFMGTVGDGYRRFFMSYLLTLLSCGLAYPWARWQRTEFVVEGLRYGRANLSWRTSASNFTAKLLKTTVLALPVVALAPIESRLGKESSAALVLRLLGLVGFVLPTAYWRAASANLLYGGLTVGSHRLESQQRLWPLLRLYVENTVAVLATLGLAIPWARIRLTRYTVSSLSLVAHGSLEVESAPDSAHSEGYGDAAADLGGVDLGVG